MVVYYKICPMFLVRHLPPVHTCHTHDLQTTALFIHFATSQVHKWIFELICTRVQQMSSFFQLCLVAQG